jgi:L-type amino acid transporter 9
MGLCVCAAVWLPFAVFFFAAAVFRTSFCVSFTVRGHGPDFFFGVVPVIIAPFLHPANKVGDTPPLPYYLYVSTRIYPASPAIAN